MSLCCVRQGLESHCVRTASPTVSATCLWSTWNEKPCMWGNSWFMGTFIVFKVIEHQAEMFWVKWCSLLPIFFFQRGPKSWNNKYIVSNLITVFSCKVYYQFDNLSKKVKITVTIIIPSFGWDVKPRSWLSVVIKNPRALLVKSRGVTPVSWPNSHHWPLSIMAS